MKKFMILVLLLMSACGRAPSGPAQVAQPAAAAPASEPSPANPPETEPALSEVESALVEVGLKFISDRIESPGAAVTHFQWDEVTLNDFNRAHPDFAVEKRVQALRRYVARAERYLSREYRAHECGLGDCPGQSQREVEIKLYLARQTLSEIAP